MRRIRQITLALVLAATALPIGACSRSALVTDEVRPRPIPCSDGAVVLSRAYPIVMLLLDRSRSMNGILDDADVAQSKWEALSNALAIALPGIDNAVELGALQYPSTTAAGLCEVPAAPSIDPARGNAASIVSLMQQSTPGDGATPTAAALELAARALFSRRATTHGRAIVLATDGAPDCNESLDVNECRCIFGGNPCVAAMRCLDDERTVAQIASYAAHDLPTYVVGIQSAPGSMFNDVLDAMARAGGRPQQNASQNYYLARSELELDAALLAIANLVGNCVFLSTSVPDPEGSMELSLDGIPLSNDQWVWQSRLNGEVVLGSDVCEYVLSHAAAQLQARVRCGTG